MAKIIGSRIADARKRAGMNRNQLARALGTSWQHVDHWEKGRTRPTLESTRRLAELLHVSADYLMGMEPSAPPGSSAGMGSFLRDLAPADLTSEEAQWLAAAPLDETQAAAEDYLALLERLRGVARAATSTQSQPGDREATGTRRKVSPSRLRGAIAELGGHPVDGAEEPEESNG